MELSRGICVLCSSNNKVVFPSQGEKITILLCGILETFIDSRRFEEISSTLKVCPSCLHGILQAAEYRQNIADYSESKENCSLCQGSEHLISITDWPHFDLLLKNINVHKMRKCSFCLHCIHFLELLEQMKINFLKKYPQLELKEKAQAKKMQIKEKTTNSKLAPRLQKKPTPMAVNELNDKSVTKTKSPIDLESALKHLRPLKYSTFNITQFRADAKLLKQVAFVKLSSPNQAARKQEKPGPRKSKKSRGLTFNDRESPSDSSKHSFFKIKLKLNPTKAPKVTSGKSTKPANKPKRQVPNKKELIVRLVKMNLNNIKGDTTDSDTEDDELTLKTPTKASLKLMPEDPLSSSKKRKTVTFAEELNTEIADDEVGNRKKNSDVTPLKSLLKNNVSPKGDLTNDSSDEELINSIKNLGKDFSDDENDASESYVKDIQKNNDAIFDSLCNSNETSSDVTEKDRKSKKRKSTPSSSESEDDGGTVRATKSGKINKKRMISRKSINGHDSDISDGTVTETRRVSKKNTNEYDESNRTETGESEEKTNKSNEFFGNFESASVSSEEDTLITLGEYKKIRRSSEATETLNPDLEESLDTTDPLALDSDENDENAEETQTNHKNNNSSRRLNTVDRIDEENSDDYFEEPKSKVVKVSDDIENNVKQNDNSANDIDPLQIPEVPVRNNDNIVVPYESCVDNDNTVSDSQPARFGNESKGPESAKLPVDTADVTDNADTSVNGRNKTDDSKLVDINKKEAISLNTDNVVLNRSDADGSLDLSTSCFQRTVEGDVGFST